MSRLSGVVRPSRAPAPILLACLTWICAVLGTPAPARAQAPLFLVNADTKVEGVKLEFPGGRSLEEDLLRDQIILRNPGFGTRIREWMDFLPLLSSPERQPFHPPDVLRDRKRLERFYHAAGFPRAQVEYEAALDTAANRIHVTFSITEGPSRILDSVRIVGPDGHSLETDLPERHLESWWENLDELRRTYGRRLSESLRIRIRDDVVNWLQNTGYPFPSVQTEIEEQGDSASLVLRVDPGARMRVGKLSVEGNDVLSRDVLSREIPLETGEWFSRALVSDGEREVLGLDMVRFATLKSARAEDGDTLVDLNLQVDDGLVHLLTGQAGYTTRSGISADASWSHRNFLGGARILQLSASARTGLLGPEANASRSYGLSVLLRQPHFFHRKLSGLARPFTEYRDDVRDRSVESGLETDVLFERGPRRNLNLRYSLAYRHVLDARPGGALGEGSNLVELLRSLDTLDLSRRTSRLSLSGRWGEDRRWSRRLLSWDGRGFVEVAGPPGLSGVEYAKVVLEGTGRGALFPWLRVMARAGMGRVYPFGASVPADDGSNRLEIYLKLRDATLTAGGSQDVRGWATELLGPKIPDLEVVAAEEDGSPGDGTLSAASYIPLGGLARWTGSVQVEFPLPLAGWPHGWHLFLDGGRVWTPDRRFLPSEEPLLPDQEGPIARFGAGMGISIATPVGPFQIDLGYKLNPSRLDVRDPGAVARALATGQSIESVPEDPIRRWHLHLSIGRIR